LTAATVLAQYADSKYVYPTLFGKKDPRPDALEGFQLSTTDPGASRWEVYGTRAWVPCHYLWNRDVRNDPQSEGGEGKGGGGRVRYNIVRADVGIGVSEGPIAEIDTIYAGEQLMWTRNFNRAFIEDPRWTTALDSNPAYMTIFTPDRDAVDFTSIFQIGDLALLENFSPETVNGYWSVIFILPHSSSANSAIVLSPLQGQPPTAGAASGSLTQPGITRRIDDGYAFGSFNSLGLIHAPNGIVGTGATRILYLNDIPSTSEDQFTVGGDYRFDSWGGGAVGDEGLGIWRLKSISRSGTFFSTTDPPETVGPIFEFVQKSGEPLTSLNATLTSGVSATAPIIFVRSQAGGFRNYDEQQGFAEYLGTSTQPVDPTLQASEPNASAHRHLAHLSISDWNLGPHGNIFPHLKALARATYGEVLGSAIKKICSRTMSDDQSDVTALPLRPLHGYSIPGGLASIQALQPILTYYGLAIQDRGGVLTFLDERDLPVVSVPSRHLNAQPGSGPRSSRGFTVVKTDEADIIKRVMLHYISLQDGSDEAEGAGTRSPNSEAAGRRDTLDIQIRPLVAPSYEVKQRAREILKRAKLNAFTGAMTLGPNYLDVLPGHCLTFESNNEHFEEVPLAAADEIDFTLNLRDIIPGSIKVEAMWKDGSGNYFTAQLTDDGAGGFNNPIDEVSITSSAIDYGSTGAASIQIQTDLDFEPSFTPIVTYKYTQQWLMRVNNATTSGYDFSMRLEMAQTTRDDPLPPVPRTRPAALPALPTAQLQPYKHHVIDMPPMFVGQSGRVLIGFAAHQEAGDTWYGASVYESPNGVDRWVNIGTIGASSNIGTALTALPSGWDHGVIDWTNIVAIQLQDENTEFVTQDLTGIQQGNNIAMVGREVIGFHEVEVFQNIIVLRGIVRGMRGTRAFMDSHVADERFIPLSGFGSQHGLIYEPDGGFAAASKTYYHRIVPGGRSVSTVETTTTFIEGRSARPAQPSLTARTIDVIPSKGVTVRWGRRSLNQKTLFGNTGIAVGSFEKYEVRAYNPAQAAALESGGETPENSRLLATKRAWSVGDESMLTPLVKREITYTNAEITADFTETGWTFGSDPIGFIVRQIGAAGASDQSDAVVVLPK